MALTNSIVYNNAYDCSHAAHGIFHMDDTAEISATYSDIEGGWSGTGNIDADPLFACRAQRADPQDPFTPRNPSDVDVAWLMGDYHLLSQAGRWDGATLSWMCDEATSPCVDTGHPAGDIGDEPSPNGEIVNMGVFGGTTEASKSY